MTKVKKNADAAQSDEINEDIAFLKDEETNPEEEAGTAEKGQTDLSDSVAETYEDIPESVAKSEYDALDEKYKAISESYLRLRADFDNYKKRTQKEKTDVMRYASCELVTKLLTVLDNFERAIAADQQETPLSAGVKMVYKQLNEILKEEGLDVIDCVDAPFDPNMHHAVMTESEKEKEDNIITEELQRGYIYKEKVIRPSMVKVNKH